ncbi:hypothetical protein HZA97_09410 [Candidatus Woesearchaeota archaeon]|nr:hypothetical protein [Candidatus Woesearchaeota archaeon]
MEKNTMIALGVILLLVVGLASFFSLTGAHGWGKDRMMGGFGPKFFGQRSEASVEDFSKVKQDLGLPEDATNEQVKEALKQKFETEKAAKLEKVKTKLGLDSSASEEQVKEALAKWREDNKDLLEFGMMRSERWK